MITEEPNIDVGILQERRHIEGELSGEFYIAGETPLTGGFTAKAAKGGIFLYDASGHLILKKASIKMKPSGEAFFTLYDVAVGIDFHWERSEKLTFRGDLTLSLDKNGLMTAINTIALEDYLSCVISSEMSAEAPSEFLKAHAIMSRSWLMSTLERRGDIDGKRAKDKNSIQSENEIVRWYDREDHTAFDVCADDHCQRYQGIKPLSGFTREACEETRGLFLVYDNGICDARYHKCCGGLTDLFENAWENQAVPYLTSVSDSLLNHQTIFNERDAQNWILSSPEAYCNTRDEAIINRILPGFDRETMDFFRWRVHYERDELENILWKKLGFDFGRIQNIIPLERGPSGRIVRLKIEGTKKAMVIGKELEIRRCLSPSHLYSSCFIVITKRDLLEKPISFTIHGAGWGHGVGLCQIGAAVMAERGFKAEEILWHYFRGAQLKRLY
ncbi:MAG: SpoIID/LytB domain-containing protein [Deltaproteobacteria bacterium]|nr:SpoIID/LytB domain-containing protein [Deltaproteobacteria bacterium]